MIKYVILLMILFNLSFGSYENRNYTITSPNNSKYITYYEKSPSKFSSNKFNNRNRNDDKLLLGFISLGVISMSMVGLVSVVNKKWKLL